MGHTLRISGPAEIIMLKIVKDSVLRVSRSFGYDIVPLREMKERDFALHLRELLAHLDIDCVLDVGANAGEYRDFLRDKVLYDGPIISFEPVSRHIDALRERSRGDRDWHIEGYALGSSGRVHADQCDGLRSVQFVSRARPRPREGLCRAERAVPHGNGHGAHPRRRAARPAGTHRLRPAVPQDRHPGVRYRGPARRRRQPAGGKALQTEASVIGIYKGMPQYMDIIRYLDERGFDITGLYPVSRDSALRLVEFDCVMINRRRRRRCGVALAESRIAQRPATSSPATNMVRGTERRRPRMCS